MSMASGASKISTPSHLSSPRPVGNDVTVSLDGSLRADIDANTTTSTTNATNIANNTTAITNEATTRATADTTLQGNIDTNTANISNNSGAITTNANAIASNSSEIATKISATDTIASGSLAGSTYDSPTISAGAVSTNEIDATASYTVGGVTVSNLASPSNVTITPGALDASNGTSTARLNASTGSATFTDGSSDSVSIDAKRLVAGSSVIKATIEGGKTFYEDGSGIGPEQPYSEIDANKIEISRSDPAATTIANRTQIFADGFERRPRL